METAIGVFNSRDDADKAAKELLQRGVPAAHNTMRNQGGRLKLTNLNKRVNDLLEMTHLSSVFDIQKNESSAITSFGDSKVAV